MIAFISFKKEVELRLFVLTTPPTLSPKLMDYFVFEKLLAIHNS
jgi:hypothetical protein